MRIEAVKKALEETKRFQMAAVRYVQKDKDDSFAKYGCKESVLSSVHQWILPEHLQN